MVKKTKMKKKEKIKKKKEIMMKMKKEEKFISGNILLLNSKNY